MSFINNVLPWFVALIIGFITVIVNIYINKTQIKNAEKTLETQADLSLKAIKKDVLSGNRQEWINKLRNYVAEYISAHEVSKLIVQHEKEGEERTEKYQNQFKTWQEHSYKIKLMLNPKEEKSKRMFNLMESLNKSTDYNSFEKENEYEQYKNEIIKTSQEILKEEWERVKELK